MSKTFCIKQPVDEDLQAALNIAVNSFSDPWSLASMKECLHSDNYVFLAVYVDANLIGYIILQVIIDEAQLVNIAVDDKYRRRGYASTLIDKALDLLKSYGYVSCVLEVRVSNSGAIALYRSLGFEKLGIRKDFYSEPLEDAYIMKKEL